MGEHRNESIDLGPSYFVGLGVTMNDASVLGTLVVSDFAISTDVETYSFPNVPIKIGESATNSADNLVRVQELGEGVWSIYTGGAGIGVRCQLHSPFLSFRSRVRFLPSFILPD